MLTRLLLILTLIATVVALLGGFASLAREWRRWRQRRLWILLVLACGLLPSTVWAATYYVATTGNDTTGTGAIGAPWLTIGKAASVVAPGDTVNLRGGTYGGTAAYVNLSTDGTASNRITYQSYAGETAIIDGSARAQGTGFQLVVVNGSYITLQNLELRQASNMSIMVGVNADHVILDSLTIHDGYRNGIGLYRNHFNTVTNSHIYNMYDFNQGGANADCIDTVDDGLGTEGGNHTITNNTVHGCSDDGIDMWQAANNTITGNLSYHNGYIGSTSTPAGNGNGYKLGPGGNNTVIDNIAYDNRIRGFDANAGSNNLVYNNTAINNLVYNYSFSPGGNLLTNNIAYLGGTNVLTGATQTTNSWQLGIVNPQFVQSTDPTTRTTFAHLQAGSPAIDVGTTVGGSSHVCVGVCDLGAIEYGSPSDVTPPAAPTGLRILEVVLPILGAGWHFRKALMAGGLAAMTFCTASTITAQLMTAKAVYGLRQATATSLVLLVHLIPRKKD